MSFRFAFAASVDFYSLGSEGSFPDDQLSFVKAVAVIVVSASAV